MGPGDEAVPLGETWLWLDTMFVREFSGRNGDCGRTRGRGRGGCAEAEAEAEVMAEAGDAISRAEDMEPPMEAVSASLCSGGNAESETMKECSRNSPGLGYAIPFTAATVFVALRASVA